MSAGKSMPHNGIKLVALLWPFRVHIEHTTPFYRCSVVYEYTVFYMSCCHVLTDELHYTTIERNMKCKFNITQSICMF